MSDTKLDMVKMEKWYTNYTGYYSNAKTNFQKILKDGPKIDKKNLPQVTAYRDGYAQNVNFKNENYRDNVLPFITMMKNNGITEASWQITKDRNERKILDWYAKMNQYYTDLNDLCVKINAYM
jgi:hypothetical protein